MCSGKEKQNHELPSEHTLKTLIMFRIHTEAQQTVKGKLLILRKHFSQRLCLEWQMWQLFYLSESVSKTGRLHYNHPSQYCTKKIKRHQKSNQDSRWHVNSPALKCQSEANPAQAKTAIIENTKKSGNHLLVKILSFLMCFISSVALFYIFHNILVHWSTWVLR